MKATMVKRLKWSIKISCLFLILAGLWLNEPLAGLYKKTVAENFKHDLAPYQITAESVKLPISGQITQLIVPKLRANLDANQLHVATKPWSCALWQQQGSNPLVNNQSGNVAIESAEFIRVADLVTGDPAYIFTDNGHRFVYRFKITISTAENFSIPDYGSPTMIVQSCSGNEMNLMLFELTEAQ